MERLYLIPIAAYALLAVDHLIPNALGKWFRQVSRWVAVGAALIHAGILVYEALVSAEPPGFPQALSAAALGMMMAYVVVGAADRLRALGLLLTPLAAVMLSTSLIAPDRTVSALETAGDSPWLPLHLGLIFVGVAGFSLSFVVGVLFLVVRRRLKSKRNLSSLRRLPSLDALDKIQFRSTLFGFVFLTLGIVAGGVFAAVSLGSTAAFLDPKVLSTLIIWVWYLIALQVRIAAGWRGRLSAWFAIVGFSGLLFSLLVLNFLVRGWHAYGA